MKVERIRTADDPDDLDVWRVTVEPVTIEVNADNEMDAMFEAWKKCEFIGTVIKDHWDAAYAKLMDEWREEQTPKPK